MPPTDRELMQMALDALEEACEIVGNAWAWRDEKGRTAAETLRARLAQPEPEPVAWADEIIYDLHAQYNTDGIKEIDSGDALIRLDEAIAAVEEAEKRHTAPPQRKPLTEEEIERACVPLGAAMLSFTEVARAIEAAHGIKENT